MTKQSFTIPEGCKAVTVEQVGNQIITTFEPVFKRGDVLIEKSSCGEYISVLDRFDGKNYHYFVSYFIFYVYDPETVKSIRHATPDEAQLLWDALAKKGKRWNPETMQVEPIKKERWRGEIAYRYWFVKNVCFEVSNTVDVKAYDDNERYNSGNYFQTEEQAQRAAARLKAELDKFWEEELR